MRQPRHILIWVYHQARRHAARHDSQSDLCEKRFEGARLRQRTVFEGAPTRLHYVTSKAGIIGFTRTLAREVGAARDQRQLHRPRQHPLRRRPQPEIVAMRRAHAEKRAIARVQTPADLVGAVVFFASEDASSITGQTLLLDGGAAMHQR